LNISITLYGKDIVSNHFENLLYPLHLGYFYGVATGAKQVYDVDDEYFIDVFDQMCNRINIGSILGSRINNKVEYMTVTRHAERDSFFIAGMKRGTEDIINGIDNDGCRGLLISFSRYIAPYLPPGFNSEPLKIFRPDTDLIKNIAIVRKMKEDNIFRKLNDINSHEKSDKEIIHMFSKKTRPTIFLLMLSFKSADSNDLIEHKRTKGASITVSKPTRAIGEMNYTKYLKYKINRITNRIIYGSEDKIKDDIESYLLNNWPTNKQNVRNGVFNTPNINDEAKRVLNRKISQLKANRRIRRYNLENTYVPLGYTTMSK
jgi:hypothetical protein